MDSINLARSHFDVRERSGFRSVCSCIPYRLLRKKPSSQAVVSKSLVIAVSQSDTKACASVFKFVPKSGPTVTAEAATGTRGAERPFYVISQKILFSVRATQRLLIISTKDHKPLYAAEFDHSEGKYIC